MEQEVTLGIDIGGTNTKLGLVGPNGHILCTETLSTVSYRDKPIEQYLEDLCRTGQDLLARVGSPKLIGIGIGAPNGNYYRGTIEFAPNLPWHGCHPLVEMFGRYFDVPVCLTNDAKAAALGEMVYGSAKGMKDFIVITLGTGVGSGIVVNGQLVYGHDGFAGELGHNTIVPDGRPCTCGRKGCLETYCSARGIRQTAIELLEESQEPSPMRAHLGENFSTVHIAEAAQQGDPLALEVFDRTGRYLAMELSNAIGFSGPEAIFLFGGVTRSGDLLLGPVRRHTEEQLLRIFQGKVQILPSAFDGDEASILGASALIVSEMTNRSSARGFKAVVH
jgi:glucokinase